ncbi:MAG: hypothetical protein CMI29_10065 [Opitutae bacterium]|nr:hypothetical protein [Opitutae bacterium]
MDTALSILRLVSDAQFEIRGNDYNRVVWDPSNTAPKPTLAQCEAAWQEILAEQPMKLLRQERNKKLEESDKFTSIPDWPHANETAKESWIIYRQALRDLPSTASPELDVNGTLKNVTWPTRPLDDFA